MSLKHSNEDTSKQMKLTSGGAIYDHIAKASGMQFQLKNASISGAPMYVAY